jgi:hypothetical protein
MRSDEMCVCVQDEIWITSQIPSSEATMCLLEGDHLEKLNRISTFQGRPSTEPEMMHTDIETLC